MSIVAYEGFAIVELMGHIRMAGRVREVEQYGTKMLAVDVPEVPDAGVKAFTSFVSGASLYRVTPTTEAIAIGIVRASRPRPVHPYDVQLEPITPKAALPPADAEVVLRGNDHDAYCSCPECETDGADEDPGF
jgi:hypothetical protein